MAWRTERVRRMLRGKQPRELGVGKDLAADAVNAEKRGASALGLNGNQ